jgi:hypothetical protein
VGILLSRVKGHSTLVEQMEIVSFSGNKLKEEGLKRVFIHGINDNTEKQMICNRKSFLKILTQKARGTAQW